MKLGLCFFVFGWFVLFIVMVVSQPHFNSSIEYEDPKHAKASHSILHHEYRIRQQKAFSALHYLEPNSGEAWWAPFDDVVVSYPIDPSMYIRVKDKLIVGPEYMKNLGEKYIVYAAGIANQPEFEEAMGALNVSVHAFDCTISANSQFNNNVKFHHWCLGKNTGFEDNKYSRESANKTFTFHSLSETKAALGHERIHALKMDIEGFEWDIIENDIIQNERSEDLPDQLLIELHAIGANPRFVPKHLSSDKTRLRVNKLILDLWKRGYRVVYKDINFADRHCADLTFLRVHH